MLPTFKSWTVYKIIEYLALGLLSSLWNIYHSTTAYFFDPPCRYATSNRNCFALSDSFWIYRRYINKSIYLSIYLTAADRVATDHFQKSQSQDGGLSNHSEAASLWLDTPKQVVGGHQWRVVCSTVEYLNFGMQKCKICAHQTFRLFAGGHLAITISVASGFITSSDPVVVT